MKKIRLGIFGAGRGYDVADNFLTLGFDLVAICDSHEERLASAAKRAGNSVAAYTDFDKFLDHGLDAVIIANFFHEHAPYIIKCMERGIHVFCECLSNGTMAEGIELLRAAKNSKSIFMLAENYPQMIFNREMQRVCRGGTLGKIVYAEGEYNHPVDPRDESFSKRFNYFEGHWRNFLPRTYYITHSLGPLMAATGATPKRVTAFSIFSPRSADAPSASYNGDIASIITIQNDDESVFRITGNGGFGAHHNAYRLCGTKGQIENVRGMNNKIMLRYNSWQIPEEFEENNLYEAQWNDPDEDLIKKSDGHGGSDFVTARMFLECIKEGRQPEFPFNLEAAVTMSSVAILAHRSALNGGQPYDIPDFNDEDCCKMYENDRLSPFATDPELRLPVCSHNDYAPTKKQLELYRELIK